MAHPMEIPRRAASNLARAVRRLFARTALPTDGGFWVSLRLAPPLDEVPTLGFGREPAPSLLQVLEILDAAAADPDVDGVFVELAGAPSGWSKTQTLRRALCAVREAGKPVVVYAESLDTESLLLASAASKIWLPETGRVFLVGVRADAFYLRGLLGHLDIEPEVVRIGSHKSAGEMFTREGMSPEHREQLEGLADDLYDVLIAGLAEGRGLAPDTVRELVDRGPYTAPAAVEAGLVDACLYPDEVERKLVELAPVPPGHRNGPRAVMLVAAPVYYVVRAGDVGRRPLLADLPHLAYVVASGSIGRGSGSGIASETLATTLRHLAAEPCVRGVVLRVDSPGGDALASELLWRELRQLRREKPVVISMAEVAASGGYYLACAGDAVFAEAGTVTGSIGVIGGKMNFEGLYRKLGIGRDAVERGAHAGLLSEARGFTGEERAAVRTEMAAMYEAFLDRVADGRALPRDAIEPMAGGRVWSGARAATLGLVDTLGGPLEALRDARRRAGLSRGERVVIDLHPKRPSLPGVLGLLRWLS